VSNAYEFGPPGKPQLYRLETEEEELGSGVRKERPRRLLRSGRAVPAVKGVPLRFLWALVKESVTTTNSASRTVTYTALWDIAKDGAIKATGDVADFGKDNRKRCVAAVEELGQAIQADRSEGYRFVWRVRRIVQIDRSKLPPIPDDYRNRIRRHCQNIDLLGSEHKDGGVTIRLQNVYVPLAIAGRGLGEGLREHWGSRPNPILILSLLDRGSLVLTGVAGCGKTTFCSWVSWLAAGEPESEAMPRFAIGAGEEFTEVYPASLKGRLPLLFRLRDTVDFLRSMKAGAVTHEEFLAVLQQTWKSDATESYMSWATAREHLEAGNALIVLDGVDEIPPDWDSGTGRLSSRKPFLKAMLDAAELWTSKGSRVLITSRPYALTESDAAGAGLQYAEIEPLPPELQSLFVRRWFRALDREDSLAAGLLGDIESRREELDELAGNPILLTSMCVVYGEDKRLPENRYDLYERMTNMVLHHRYQADTEVRRARWQLACVAHEMHTGELANDHREQPSARVPHGEIQPALARMFLETGRNEKESERAADDALQDLLSRSGLLVPAGGDHAKFYHLSIQDFLAAQLAKDPEESEFVEFLRQRSRAESWRSALGFAAVARRRTAESPRKVLGMLERLIESTALTELSTWVFIGDWIRILMREKANVAAAALTRFRESVDHAIRTEAPLRQRVELGLALGHVGDLRIVQDLRIGREEARFEDAFVRVPKGIYRLGEPEKTRTLKSDLFVARFPVTNSQYWVFMEDKGYEEVRWWSKEGLQWKRARLKSKEKLEPEDWNHSVWNAPNQPVVGVSYVEAEAFAAWCGGRLPGEWEWEAAARGPNSLHYPWGGQDTWRDGICNSYEAGLQKTTPVGLFPASRQKDTGIEDLAGNVWEWCGNFYDREKKLRVLRGGSWDFDSRFVRAAFRYWFIPGWRNGSVGFRVIR